MPEHIPILINTDSYYFFASLVCSAFSLIKTVIMGNSDFFLNHQKKPWETFA